MKLKYYLKGFGIGVLFATIIIAISFYMSGRGKEISDEDIILRAEVLGMVMEEETTQAAETTVVKEAQKIEETTRVEETTGIEETTTVEETTTIQETTTLEETTTSIGAITIIIENGWSSDKVASTLKEKGVISESKEFNQYLIEQGVSRKIRAGTYQMFPGMTYEEILNVLK